MVFSSQMQDIIIGQSGNMGLLLVALAYAFALAMAQYAYAYYRGVGNFKWYNGAQLGVQLSIVLPLIFLPELTVKRTSYNTISLNWTKVSGATGYKIYRSETNADHFKLLKTIEGDSALIYKDNTCKSGMRYYYKVRAYTSYLRAGHS